MTIKITSSEAAVAATPYLFGFTPTDSFVLLLCDPGTMRGSLRVDLPDEPNLAWLGSVVEVVPDPAPASAILIVYADTVPLQFAEKIIDWVMEVLRPVTDILDLVIVHDGLVRSILGEMKTGEIGVPLADLDNHPVVAALVSEGLVKVANREELAARLDPIDDDVTRQVLELLDGEEPDVTGYEQWRALLEARSVDLLLGKDDLQPLDVVHIGLACCDIYARDPMLTVLLEENARGRDRLCQARDRLVYAITHLPDDVAGPAAATLALLSWAGGDGTSALIAAERAMTADPSNTLAPLVADALQHGLPPDTWLTLTQDIPMNVLRGQLRRTA